MAWPFSGDLPFILPQGAIGIDWLIARVSLRSPDGVIEIVRFWHREMKGGHGSDRLIL
jgi:hypothetical protein